MTQLPGPTKLLSDAWLVYKMRARTIVLLLVVSLVVSWAVSFVLLIVLILGVVVALFLKSLLVVILFISIGIILLIVSSFIQTWFNLAFISAVVFYREDKSIGQLLSESRSKVLRYWWLSILSSMIMIFGYIFFIIPGFIFSVWFGFAMFILISENMGGMDALLKSREYVKGYFWEVLFRLAFITCIFIAGGIIIFVLNFLLAYLKLSAVSSFAQPFLWIIVSPLFLIYNFLLYDNLKAIKGTFNFQPSTTSKTLFYFFAAAPFILLILVGVLIGPTLLNVAKDFPKLLNSATKSPGFLTSLDCKTADLTQTGSVENNRAMSCFASAASGCIPAKIQIKQNLPFTINGLDTTSNITTSYETSQLNTSPVATKAYSVASANSCNLKANLISQSFTLPRGTTSANYDKVSAQTTKIINQYLGAAGSCTLSDSSLSSIFTNWSHGTVNVSDFAKENCTGNYFEMLKSATPTTTNAAPANVQIGGSEPSK